MIVQQWPGWLPEGDSLLLTGVLLAGSVGIAAYELERRRRLPSGLCGDRSDHRPHLHESETLGRFRCRGRPDPREERDR